MLGPFRDFDKDTRLEGGDGRYCIRLDADWEVWGPLGGYMAAIALRAMGRESHLTRPASIQCQFLASAAFEELDVEVHTLRRGKRSHALQVRMSQGGQLVHTAIGWVVDDGMEGLNHDHAQMPEVPHHSELKPYSEVGDNFEEWFPVWHHCLDGRPVRWDDEAQPPTWHAWMRLFETPQMNDPFLDAARSLMWLDLMMWNAASYPHLPWPVRYVAPNLDVSASFHAPATKEEWLLCESHAPVGAEGLIGCYGRVWSESGRLIASGNSTLFCRPNPMYEQQLREKREWEAKQSQGGS